MHMYAVGLRCPAAQDTGFTVNTKLLCLTLACAYLQYASQQANSRFDAAD